MLENSLLTNLEGFPIKNNSTIKGRKIHSDIKGPLRFDHRESERIETGGDMRQAN
jgi:hypothetical protein